MSKSPQKSSPVKKQQKSNQVFKQVWESLNKNNRINDPKNSQNQLKQKKRNRERFERNKAEFYVEFISDKIRKQILAGMMKISKDKINLDDIYYPSEKKPNEIDPVEHKNKILKFIKQGKQFQKRIKERTQEEQEKIKWQEALREKEKQIQRQKLLTERKQKVIERFQKHKLIQLKQQQEYKSKIREQRIYQKLKSQKKILKSFNEQSNQSFRFITQNQSMVTLSNKNQKSPMNFRELKKHQQNYLKIKQSRTKTQQKSFQKSPKYDPPSFVPKSYKILELEEKKRLEEQKEKQKQRQHRIQKKQKYTQLLDEYYRKKLKASKETLSQTNQTNNQKSISALTIEQIKQKGKTYLQINKSKAKVKPPVLINQENMQPRMRNIFSTQNSIRTDSHEQKQFLDIQKEIRMNKNKKIRKLAIQNILSKKNKTKSQQLKLLDIESKKFDRQLSRKVQLSKLNITDYNNQDQAEDILINSVHTKLALLDLYKKK